ncbi:MAG TPA: MFS transporter [Firmicutes bacterium]|jgi:MFS family permease|nr:MFS transporter [Bacillota bacterium]
MKNKGFIAFILFGLLFMMSLFLRSSPAVIANDLMREFSILPVTMGLMASVYFWAYGLVQIPVGYLSDRIGVRNTVVIFALIGVVGTFAFAFAQNVQMATWTRLCFGIGTAGIWVPALKYLSVSYSPGEFASLTSILSSIGSTGMILSSFPLAVLVERTNWRFPFIWTAVIILFLLICAWRLIPAKTTAPKTNNDVPTEEKNNITIIEYVKKYYKVFLFFIWAFLIYGSLFSFQGLWGVPYLQDVFSISRQTAGITVMLLPLGIILGGPFWGILSDRYFKARRPILLLGTIGFLATIIAFVLIRNYPGSFVFSIIYFFYGFFGTVFLINLTCVKEHLPLEITGTVMGILNTLMIMSVGFYQNITGYYLNYFLTLTSTATAYQNVFIIYCLSAAVALVIVLLMPETFKE